MREHRVGVAAAASVARSHNFPKSSEKILKIPVKRDLQVVIRVITCARSSS